MSEWNVWGEWNDYWESGPAAARARSKRRLKTAMGIIGGIFGLIAAGIIFYRLIFGWPEDEDTIVVYIRFEDEDDGD